MGRRKGVSGACLALLWLGLTARAAVSAEIVTLTTPGGQVRGELVRVTAAEAVIKDAGGKEKQIPLILLPPKEVYLCRRLALAPSDARGRFELGEFCLKQGLKSEAEDQLSSAARLDPAAYGEKVAALLAKPEEKAVPPEPAPEAKTPEPVAKQEPAPTPTKPEPKTTDAGKDKDEGEVVIVTGPDGKKYNVPVKFIPSKKNVPPRSPEQMKAFLGKRLEELKTVCGGEWVQDETDHFYIFTNLKKEHQLYFKACLEELYKTQCDVMGYKQGEPLWNNKAPVYFIAKRRQFELFAAQIDKAPGGAYSGGYFHHEGRQMHIVIPLYDFMNEKEQIRRATNTLRHESTHAFLQLVGENVELTRWLHEGMAQFVEFWYDPQNNPDRNEHVTCLREWIRRGEILSWQQGKMRPMGGGDRFGYAYAWTRILFLYHFFLPDRTKIPRMIRLIKSGKSEEQAMEEAYGKPVGELERLWEIWIKEMAKHNFRT